jgi:hypothetical protein
VNADDTLTADPDGFATDADTADAATGAYWFAPIKNTVKTYLTCTVTGAEATGKVTVVLLYMFEGD